MIVPLIVPFLVNAKGSELESRGSIVAVCAEAAPRARTAAKLVTFIFRKECDEEAKSKVPLLAVRTTVARAICAQATSVE